MAIPARINGVWRDVQQGCTKINGVWRDTNSWAKINGVWRETFEDIITEESIKGFHLVYLLNKEKTHPSYPKLIYNAKIPYKVSCAGENVGIMDTTNKSIVFEYSRNEYKEEGIVMYEGTLYAELTNGKYVDISHINTSSLAQNVRLFNRTKDLEITLQGYSTYESYGYFVDGWNNFFETETFLNKENMPIEKADKNIHTLNLYHILSVAQRSDIYDSVASIGIARDMTSPTHNMVGSMGTIDQTIQAIYCNGVSKPFVIEIYN